jgi:membrane fusion protein, copper/silver efflux system
MRKSVFAGAAVVAVLASAIAGYRYGAGTWPALPHSGQASQPASIQSPAAKPVLYWKDPDSKNDFSPEPKKTADGRDYLPVYEDGEAFFKEAKTAGQQVAGRKILYYRNPMGLPDVSPVPKKDSMGMDYVPVYESEDDGGPAIKLSPGKLQRTGVRSEAAARRVLTVPIRAPGTVQADEHRQAVVALRFDAFLNELEHITTGSYVHKGEPMMRVYSSALSAAAAQYVTDLGLRDTGGLPQNRGARQRLENLGVPAEIIAEIEKNRQGSLTVTWPAPRNGFVIEHNVVEGMQAKAGDILFRIADLSVVWVLADVAERDLGLIAPGQTVTVTPRGYPARSFTGKIGLIYPVLNKETRTARVRIELANPDGILKPNMYADALIESGSGAPVIAVPESAVINSGARQLVIVDKGEGRFEPRKVKAGMRGNGFVEIKEGVSEGEKAVTAANFLIDAESNLRAALQSLTTGDAQ